MSRKNKNSKGGDTMYAPFAGKDDSNNRYKLKPTSKENVSALCQVMAERITLSGRARAQYADQAGITPERYEEQQLENGDVKKVPVFELDDIWTEYNVHAAMAQELFWGFPEIIQAEYNEDEEKWETKILDEEKFNALDEGVVNEAFLAFSQQRNGIQNALLNNSRN